jgi:2-dehydro-3-deoxyphosphooctonate aldolase (KDO 8-P synthase)
MNVVDVSGVPLGGPRLVLIAGPCVAESLDLCMTVAEALQDVTRRLEMPFIFKASFDKANRTSGSSARGPGLAEGLGVLRAVWERVRCPVTTDVHLPDQCTEVAGVVDLLQIPAFLCRQTDLLVAAAATGKPVNVKKGQFLAPWDAKNIVEKLRAAGAAGVVLTERGTSFGYNNLIVDMAGLPIMRSFGVPVVFDATHSAQRPGGAGTASGGDRDSIPTLARAAVAAGVDGIFMEVHPDPDRALSDSATQWPLARVEPLLRQLLAIHGAAQTETG